MKVLTAYYDLAFGPVSFDVIPFLIQARMAAEDAGCDKLHIVIVPDESGIDGMFRNKLHLYDAPEKHWRLWNIVIPACQLASASFSLAINWDHARQMAKGAVWPSDWDSQSLKNKHYLTNQIMTVAKAGRKIPKLQASAHARKAVRFRGDITLPLITITLRNTYEPERNSDSDFWYGVHEKFSNHFDIRFIHDTNDALKTGIGFGELNLDLRMALYQEAVMNFQPNGGPSQLCWFSDAPFIEFGAALPSAVWGKHWIKNVGLEIGEQLPWARKDQTLVYEKETMHRVCEALNV